MFYYGILFSKILFINFYRFFSERKEIFLYLIAVYIIALIIE
jgi:hypothetical protein